MTDSQHILIVDDDREIRTLLRDFLEKNGYRATAVPDGKGMRRALEQSHVDLIVLDHDHAAGSAAGAQAAPADLTGGPRAAP